MSVPLGDQKNHHIQSCSVSSVICLISLPHWLGIPSSWRVRFLSLEPFPDPNHRHNQLRLVLLVVGIPVPSRLGHPTLQHHANTGDGAAEYLEDQERNHESDADFAFIAEAFESCWDGHTIIEVDGNLQLAGVGVELLSTVCELAGPGLQGVSLMFGAGIAEGEVECQGEDAENQSYQ